MAAIIAGPKLSIRKPFTKYEVVISRKAFITSVKSPRVRMLIGNVRIIMIGLIKAFKIPKTSATISAVVKLATWKPGTNWETAIIVSAETIQLTKMLSMRRVYQRLMTRDQSVKVNGDGFAVKLLSVRCSIVDN